MRKAKYNPPRGSLIWDMCQPHRPSDSGLYYTGPSAPVDPAIGTLFFDAAKYGTYAWDGFQWNLVSRQEDVMQANDLARIASVSRSAVSTWTRASSWHTSGLSYDQNIPPGEVWVIPSSDGGNP